MVHCCEGFMGHQDCIFMLVIDEVHLKLLIFIFYDRTFSWVKKIRMGIFQQSNELLDFLYLMIVFACLLYTQKKLQNKIMLYTSLQSVLNFQKLDLISLLIKIDMVFKYYFYIYQDKQNKFVRDSAKTYKLKSQNQFQQQIMIGQPQNTVQLKIQQEKLREQPHQVQVQPIDDNKKIFSQYIEKMADINIVKDVNPAKQRLEVSLIPETQKNPQIKQQTNKQQTNQFDNQKIGPFNAQQREKEFQLKKLQQPMNFQLDVSPILNLNSSPKNNSKILNKKPLYKQKQAKKSANILTQQSVHQSQSNQKVDQTKLQAQILQLAKNIRKKVIKKLPISKSSLSDYVNNQENSLFHNKNLSIVENHSKSIDTKLKKIYEKRLSVFEKYSFPRTGGLSLSQIKREQQQSMKAQKYNTSRVYNEQQVQQQSIQNHQLKQIPQKRSYSRTQDSKTSRKKNQLLPKIKLNLDPNHHKYRVTQFRKSILKQKKQRQFAKQLIEKQKQEILLKRKTIFHNSRYHPVGIKLSNLNKSKLLNGTNIQKLNMNLSLINDNNLLNNLIQQKKTQNLLLAENLQRREQSSLSKRSIAKQQNSQQMNTHQKQQLPDNIDTLQPQLINPSEIKSSLTFNFSFSDPLNPQSNVIKTQSQVYKQLYDLTKELQNDSTPQQRLQKMNLQEEQKNAFNKNKISQVKKWSPANVQKQMTQSKNEFESVQKLHNSSDQPSQNQENQYDKMDFEYSYA